MSNTTLVPETEKKSSSTVKLLTFNTWGLKYISHHRTERIQAIANKLGNPTTSDDDYDIVALQELWCEDDWKCIQQACKGKYPYSRVFKSGIVAGPGLAILSKIPIAETFLYRFPINGRPSAFFRGDWFVGKGVAVTLFKSHDGTSLPIALLNSHMHAPYAANGDASYSTHRACQAWDFTKLVKMLKQARYAVIQVGDLNSKPGSLPYKLFTIEGGLSDSWNLVHEDRYEDNLIELSPQDQVLHAGITCNSTLNSYRTKSEAWQACRLDYALIDANNITPINASVKFTERLPPPLNCSYSDHFAYSAEFTIKGKDEFVTASYEDHQITIDAKESVYRELLAEVNEYRQYTIPFQATWRKIHFFLSLIITIALHVGVYFVSGITGWIPVVFVFITVLVILSGCINGLIWYCGVRPESRALQEVQMEVEDAYTYLKS
ncbi:Inositol phosphosphingolipids phospholipase C [Spathaspora sp. JA1]|nr:Inositol phosphosphingolipids phospholipase C [Spathaspora sp. JA1]